MPPFDFSVPASGVALVRTVVDVGLEHEVCDACSTRPRWTSGRAGSPPSSPEVGERYEFGVGPRSGRDPELEADKTRTAYSWLYPDSPDTVVKWSLRSSRGSTYLTLLHSGFDNDELAEEYRQGVARPSWCEIKRILELGDQWEPLHA